MLFDGHFYTDWGADEARESRFVFIGKNLDHKELADGFEKCKAPDELRFAVGDAVEAMTEAGWVKGRVTALWDEGNPYRIQFEDGNEVHGPDDSDELVKAA